MTPCSTIATSNGCARWGQRRCCRFDGGSTAGGGDEDVEDLCGDGFALLPEPDEGGVAEHECVERSLVDDERTIGKTFAAADKTVKSPF